MEVTQEQQNVIDAVCSNKKCDKIIAVNAVAGSGKTSTCVATVESFKPINGFYTAFNKGIVEDSKKKIGKLIPCNTIHSLAYKYANPTHRNVRDLTYRDINENLSVKDKVALINAFDVFCRSKYTNLDEFLKVYPCTVDSEYVLKYADLMLQGKIAPTFSFLLKKFHLMLIDEVIHPTFDLFIVDECQDLSEVMLEILKLIDADKKLILGDRYQNIYTFMNTVNAFDELDEDTLEIYPLTKSFRCRPNIAYDVEAYGKHGLHSEYSFKGNENLKVDKYNPSNITYLCKLNSSLIKQIHNHINQGKSFRLIRSVDSIFEFPLAMECAARGMDVYSPRYKYLQDYYKSHGFRSPTEFLTTVSISEYFDEQTVNMAKLIMEFRNRGINLWNLRDKVKNMIPDNNYTLSTIHAYKGLEADNVIIDPDIYNQVAKLLGTVTTQNIEDARLTMIDKEKETLNLMYVAKSRARYNLMQMRAA